MNRLMIIGLAGAGVALTGCQTYKPQPLNPAETAAAFQRRSFTDPGLRTYVLTHLPVAASAYPPPSWDLATLTLVAFYFHPDLDVARARLGVAAAKTITAGERPNPIVGATPGHTDSPVAPWLYGVTFDIPIETAGKRGYRLARAKNLTEAARFALGETAWQVRSRLRIALVAHLLAVRELSLCRVEERLREDVVGLLEARLAAGEASRPDMDAARADLAGMRLAVLATQGRVAETRFVLAGALGLTAAALEGAPFAEPPPPDKALSDGALQRAGLLNRLELQRALAKYAAAESALQLEIAKQYPDLHLGPGYGFDGGENKYRLGLSITLPIFNQNQGPIAEAEARRKEAAAGFLALQARIIGETAAALAHYHATETQQTEADKLLVLAKQRLKTAQQAVELGEADRLALSTVKIHCVVAELARLDAVRQEQEALGRLEDAVQRPLDGSAPLPPLSKTIQPMTERKP